MIANKSKNWLLMSGIIAAFLCGILYIFIGIDQPYEGSRNYSDKSLKFLLFAAVIFAPISEEIAFRGFYTGKKWMKIASFVVLPLFMLTGFTSGEWIIILLSILFITTYLLSLKFTNPHIVNFSIILNVLLFASIHYTSDDLLSPHFYYVPLAQIAAGCLLIWITINFNLLKAMLFHFLWNATFMILLIYGLQFPDTEFKTFSNESISIEWVEVPLFGQGKTKIIETEGLIEGTNVEARFLYRIISGNQTPEQQIMQQDPYVKYNFKIKSMDAKNSRELLKNETKKFLVDQGIVYLNN